MLANNNYIINDRLVMQVTARLLLIVWVQNVSSNTVKKIFYRLTKK
jgi:hypothetical protein